MPAGGNISRLSGLNEQPPPTAGAGTPPTARSGGRKAGNRVAIGGLARSAGLLTGVVVEIGVPCRLLLLAVRLPGVEEIPSGGGAKGGLGRTPMVGTTAFRIICGANPRSCPAPGFVGVESREGCANLLSGGGRFFPPADDELLAEDIDANRFGADEFTVKRADPQLRKQRPGCKTPPPEFCPTKSPFVPVGIAPPALAGRDLPPDAIRCGSRCSEQCSSRRALCTKGSLADIGIAVTNLAGDQVGWCPPSRRTIEFELDRPPTREDVELAEDPATFWAKSDGGLEPVRGVINAPPAYNCGRRVSRRRVLIGGGSMIGVIEPPGSGGTGCGWNEGGRKP